ncbi:MAG: DUF2155 domain-containing protein [Caulobacteraceae bacterium]|nr:DUF2155 domain-containing protein [Caulobacteraceae bacterium]
MSPRAALAMAIGGVFAASIAVAGMQAESPEPGDAPTPVAPPPPPVSAPTPPPPDLGPVAAPPPVKMAPVPDVGPLSKAKPVVTAVAETPPPPPDLPPTPPPPPKPVRSPLAVLQVLDKVSAETLRFEAPVGRKIQYKNLIVQVKACETRGLTDPLPKPSAYLEISSRYMSGGRRAETEQVYSGWMFANAPTVHALEHPVYDLWLISCSAAAPST